MAKNFKVAFKTPIGELRWVSIQKGGIDTSMEKNGSKMQKVATVYLTGEAKDIAIKNLNDIWEQAKIANGVKKGIQPKSLGWKEVIDKDTGEATGEISIRFSTNATFPDGKDSNIPVLNSKGIPVNLGEKLIGNGSRGVIHGEAAYYDAAGSKGITLYLKAIQLTKFIEYEANVDAEDLSGQDSESEEGFDEIPF